MPCPGGRCRLGLAWIALGSAGAGCREIHHTDNQYFQGSKNSSLDHLVGGGKERRRYGEAEHLICANVGLLDHSVSQCQQLVWNLEAKRLRGLEINH
jgi:hypothetical protein